MVFGGSDGGNRARICVEIFTKRNDRDIEDELKRSESVVPQGRSRPFPAKPVFGPAFTPGKEHRD
jgi:hypothetical protein